MRFTTIFWMRSQLKNPEEFSSKLDDFENVRADKRILEISWITQSEDKNKFHRPIEILAAVSSRIQEQLIVPANIYQLLKIPTEDGGERKTELLQPRIAIKRTNRGLSVARNEDFGELKREIERLREDLERLRYQR
ncbi:hypothetical protein AVEN_38970-1 [Araneus ventricosus]|uniref:Uncharacterized protein n=1 Tax=Araneus ventricosus TaxID=182803 RepID=A0A4Y2II41_ARAVE|nr:hypothetical protein AVEN_38970-1 [Araneus ventricosus]